MHVGLFDSDLANRVFKEAVIIHFCVLFYQRLYFLRLFAGLFCINF